MANPTKQAFLNDLSDRVGAIRSLPNSQSLFEINEGRACVYVRYSKRHGGNRTFYGLRRQDLQHLEGRRSFICFLWDGQTEPLLIPFNKYEDLFQSIAPATDGQYKAQVLLREEGADLYVAGGGRFNVESHFGWEELILATGSRALATPNFTHAQVQTLLGAIGAAKGFDIWIPRNDRGRLGCGNAPDFQLTNQLPTTYENIRGIVEQVDVVWLAKGGGQIHALYEVEHSTTIYSGLLRFNDIHLVAASLLHRFSIVAEDTRRAKFSRQIHRPTFKASGLHELCSFLEYPEVFGWYTRLYGRDDTLAEPNRV